MTNAFNVDNVSLTGGTDDYVATNAEIATAYEKFNDKENVDLSLLLCIFKQVLTQSNDTTTAVIDIANDRKDCVAFISPARQMCPEANAVTQTQNGILLMSYHRLVMLLSIVYKYMYDRYNDVYRFVPLNGHC